MAKDEIRRDAKGRKLRTGENQRSDGRYEYKYTDLLGKRRTLYSWRLTKADPLPKGKRECEPLRDQIARVEKDKADGIIPNGGDLTLIELLEQLVQTKKRGKTGNTTKLS
ncbi:MAG: integrase DNA-binding domain-containing protein [Clostridiales bacterium]|nr:integrase DNA-binding domain-containing protein [Clostridiales bacterium]